MQMRRSFFSTVKLVKTRSVLITGADTSLGTEVSKQMLVGGWETHITISDSSFLQREFKANPIKPNQWVKWDPFASASEGNIAEILNLRSGRFDAIVHCASPPLKQQKPLLAYSSEEVEKLNNLMQNETTFLIAAANHLLQGTKSSVLVIMGDKIGSSHLHSCSMPWLVKGYQRQLAAALEHEVEQSRKVKNTFVRYVNCGEYGDQTEVIDPDQLISTQGIARTVSRILSNPVDFPSVINLLSKQEQEPYGLLSYKK
jgi:NADP-dependent 3-hydroxy acid dehydrogenase YdfG